MYLHLGDRVSIHKSTIVGIFDLENTTIGSDTRAYLNRLEQDGHVINVSSEMPKSFIVCMKQETEFAYISSISVSTLKKRAMV